MKDRVNVVELVAGGIAGSDATSSDVTAPPTVHRSVPVRDIPAEPADRDRQTRSRLDRPRRYRRRGWLTSNPGSGHAGHTEGHSRRIGRERVRLLALLVVGVVCLLAAHGLQSHAGSLFAWPSDAVGWAAMVLGLAGIWLVPGLWLSAVIMRTGAGRVAWLGTRIATTLLWYALVGPVIHHLGEGAQVTTRGILIATLAATSAVMIGTLLGLSRWPAQQWFRVLIAGVVAGVCTQAVISLSMSVWSHDMNYSHIRRLDWMIVLGCALLAAVGVQSPPKLPARLTSKAVRNVLFFLATVAATAVTLSFANINWPPGQRMPSAFGIEQLAAPVGADFAFALTPIGAEGLELIEQAAFTASDEVGHAIPIKTRLVGTNGGPTLHVLLPDGGRQELCRLGRPSKLTVRDRTSGVRVQAVVPDQWCLR